jgi:hypothetical protein
MNKQYLNQTEGINRSASKHLMKPGELKHSTNTDFKKVGVLGKRKGMTLFWDTGKNGAVQHIKQVGSNIYAIVGGELHLKGTGKISGSAVIADAEPQNIDDYLMVVDNNRTIKSVLGSTYDAGVNSKGAPVCDFIKKSKNVLYAIDKAKNRVYRSSALARIAAKVVGDHEAGAVTINVTSTKYLRVGDWIEVYEPKATNMKYLFQINAITGLTSFTVNAIAMMSAVTFTGAGLDDEVVTGSAYTGTDRRFYEVEVVAGGATNPNTFRWRVNGGAWSANLNMATTDTTIELGVKIKWTAVTGHTAGNKWSWYQTPGRLVNGDELFYQNYHTTEQIMWNIDDNYGDFFLVENVVGAADQMGTLLIVGETECHRYSDNRLDRICGYGTRSPKTIANMGKMVLFANEKNIIAIDGNGGYPISNKVEPYLLGMDASGIAGMCAGANEESGLYRVFIGDTSEENMTDVEIIADTNNFKCDTASGRDITCYSQLVIDGSRDMYIGDSSGKIYKIDSGTSDAGKDIAWVAVTKDDEMEEPDKIKLWKWVTFLTVPGTLLNVAYSVDGGDPVSLGEISGQVTSFDLTSVPRGVTISFILTEVSGNSFPGYEGYILKGEIDQEA